MTRATVPIPRHFGSRPNHSSKHARRHLQQHALPRRRIHTRSRLVCEHRRSAKSPHRAAHRTPAPADRHRRCSREHLRARRGSRPRLPSGSRRRGSTRPVRSHLHCRRGASETSLHSLPAGSPRRRTRWRCRRHQPCVRIGVREGVSEQSIVCTNPSQQLGGTACEIQRLYTSGRVTDQTGQKPPIGAGCVDQAAETRISVARCPFLWCLVHRLGFRSTGDGVVAVGS